MIVTKTITTLVTVFGINYKSNMAYKRKKIVRSTARRRTSNGITFTKEQRLMLIEKLSSDHSDEAEAIKRKLMK